MILMLNMAYPFYAGDYNDFGGVNEIFPHLVTDFAPFVGNWQRGLFNGGDYQMDVLTFYKLAKGFKYINAFAATVQSAHETGNWTSYLVVKCLQRCGDKSRCKVA